ncbi:hypothetical protein DMC63_05745 [Streptomyces sp. WAC 05977]|nr:hypothetical protein DMC63_05745 [Streptomyces sp. WAC 05977]
MNGLPRRYPRHRCRGAQRRRPDRPRRWDPFRSLRDPCDRPRNVVRDRRGLFGWQRGKHRGFDGTRQWRVRLRGTVFGCRYGRLGFGGHRLGFGGHRLGFGGHRLGFGGGRFGVGRLDSGRPGGRRNRRSRLTRVRHDRCAEPEPTR